VILCGIRGAVILCGILGAHITCVFVLLAAINEK
jgi:hypothetical protein